MRKKKSFYEIADYIESEILPRFDKLPNQDHEDIPMTTEERKALRTLREKGYAVVVFSPKELNRQDRVMVQDSMLDHGWAVIASLSGPFYG